MQVGDPFISRVSCDCGKSLRYAHIVYKGESSDSPFFLCYQRLISLIDTTNCRKSLVFATWGRGWFGGTVIQQGLDQITYCNFRVVECPLYTQKQTFAQYRLERPLMTAVSSGRCNT